LVCITNGSQGSRVFFEGREYSIPAFPPQQLVDPTGAGDCYLAGFLYAQSLFDSPEEQGRFAAMVATMALERKGPFDRTAQEVIQRLNS